MKRGALTLTYVGALVLLGIILIPSVLPGQATAETFTATATVQAGGKSAAEPVRLVIHRYVTDAERAAVIEALKTGGAAAARPILEKIEDLGTLEVLGRSTPIKYAFARSMGPGAGRIITVVTAQPVHYLKVGTPEDKPKTGYDFGVAFLILDEANKGDGEIAPAAKIKLDQSGAIVVDDYGAAKVWLKAVAKAK